jgi:hypothetical protein
MSGTADKSPPGELVSKLRVVKKLAPIDRGAIKLRQQFGETLVCVRHRVDAEARIRYTTVELLVDKAEMQPRQPQMVHIRIDPKEYGLRTVIRTAGAVWDYRLGLWQIPKRVATILRLTARIVQTR